MKRVYDVAVIGAGPAGSSAAREAALLGLDVMLLDKEAMPRPKLCGGAVSKAALDSLGFGLPGSLADGECFGARVRFRDWSSETKAAKSVAVLVSREKFDHFLVQKAVEAGAEFAVGKAEDIRTGPRGLEIVTARELIPAKAAVIAQGASGRLIRKVRVPDGPATSGICIEHRFATAKPDRFADLKEIVDIQLGVAPFGYGWVFHHGTYCSVGVGMLRSAAEKPVDLFRSFCRLRGLLPPDSGIRGHLIPLGGVRRNLAADRLLLAGDSAGFVDAFYGEGIAYAVKSGRIAARVLASAIREGNLSRTRLSEYARICRAEFGLHLEYSLRLSEILHRAPWLFMRIFSRNPGVLDEYIKVPAGKKSYLAFIRWLLVAAPWLFAKGAVGRRGSARRT